MTQALQISKRLDDGTILVIGGDTPEDFTRNATALVGGEGAADLVGLFFELIPASAGSNPNPGPHATPEPEPDSAIAQALKVLQAAGLSGTAVTSDAPAASAGPSCKHGPREFKEGVGGKSGKPYKMWKCTSRDRADECPAEWVR
jgi:hypothetical protein